MTTVVHAAGHRIEIGEQQVLVDGTVKRVSASGLVALRVLAHYCGRVVARDALLQTLPGCGGDTHAVESVVFRLRAALGDHRIVATVVKRGYRLALDDSDTAVQLRSPTSYTGTAESG